jgi:hypothetical protein
MPFKSAVKQAAAESGEQAKTEGKRGDAPPSSRPGAKTGSGDKPVAQPPSSGARKLMLEDGLGEHEPPAAEQAFAELKGFGEFDMDM